MLINLTWKKRLSSDLYNIYKEGEIIGSLNDKTFSNSAEGELYGQSYKFETKGFFKRYTDIIDAESNEAIGRITFNNWMTKAVIEINDRKASWKYDNIWASKWSLLDEKGNKINYAGSSSKGSVFSNTDDALLLLSGLFVTSYYWQMTIFVIIISFIPIWITLIN